MRKLSEEQWQSLAGALQREMTRLAPDWTAHNTHDPGITVLELLSYALTELQYRSNAIDANGRTLARHIARLAASLAGVTDTDDCPPGLQRVTTSPACSLAQTTSPPSRTTSWERSTATTGCCTAPAS